MEFPFAVIIQWLSDFLLPLVRISSMIMIMAGLGAKNVPSRIKLGLAVVVTFVAVPMLPPATFNNLFSFEMILVVIQQMLIGVAIGVCICFIAKYFCSCWANTRDANRSWFCVRS